MAATKIGLLGNLFKKQRPQPNNWTPQSGPGPVQPAYGRPQQAQLPQNRINQVMPGAGNVGGTFGTTVQNNGLVKYWRNIQATVMQMVGKSLAKPQLWFEFTISASDQDYLTYRIGASLDLNGNGRIVLYETMVKNGKRDQEKYLPPIKVMGYRFSQADLNVILNNMSRRYGILLVNLQTRFNFSTALGTTGQQMPNNVNNAKVPKTTAAISNQTIKLNLLTSIGKLIDGFTDSNQFILNATDSDYLRYTLTGSIDGTKSGLIYVKEDLVKNGAAKYKAALLSPPIRISKGNFNTADFSRILGFIIPKYQSLITTTRYNTVV